MTALEQMIELANQITAMKKEAVRTGVNKVTYETGIGTIKTEYYHSCRWNDRPSTVGTYRG